MAAQPGELLPRLAAVSRAEQGRIFDPGENDENTEGVREFTRRLQADPDFVFLAPIDIEVERGRPVSQPIFYMDHKTRATPCSPPAGRT